MTTDRVTLARAVASAVTAVPGIAGLSTGSAVEVATQFAGGRVVGVQLGDVVRVSVIASAVPLPPILEKAVAAAEKALRDNGDSRRVQVVAADVQDTALRKAMSGRVT